jgi:5-methylcytosine-specific restriction enzyme subunit McrC
MLNLDTLWERVVRQMAVEAATAAGGRPARADEGRITTHGGFGKTPPPFRPDVLLAFDSPDSPDSPDPADPADPAAGRLLAVDAKYKAYQNKNVSADDRHQLLTYIAGYTAPAAPLAVIVHPGPQGASRRTLEIKGPGGRLGLIEVLGLDTSLTPQQAAEPLRELVAQFAGADG